MKKITAASCDVAAKKQQEVKSTMRRPGFIFTAVMLVLFFIGCNPSDSGGTNNGNGNNSNEDSKKEEK